MINFELGSGDPNGVFEYGSKTNKDYEELLIEREGTIPKYKGVWRIPLNIRMEYEITYIRVEYRNDVSKVRIDYDKNRRQLKFKIKLPFVDTTYYLVGYVIPKGKIDEIKKENETKALPTSDIETLRRIFQWMELRNLRTSDLDRARKMF
ncbi:hypothetical protein O0L34_g8436 [Tuta absoluta]|nr:hypothetical protein O0L34_g8436 [Tuta absoluta]